MKDLGLIKKLKNNNATAQKQLYDSYAPIYMGLCLRYLKDKSLAEDALLQGFMKIFTQVNSFIERGSFEAWMHRIMVNECLMILRKNKDFKFMLNADEVQIPTHQNALDGLYEKDLLNLIQNLPDGCRTVFNLFIIEGYSHKEIAYKLGISEGTSKSQLNLAKTKLKQFLQSPQNLENYGR